MDGVLFCSEIVPSPYIELALLFALCLHCGGVPFDVCFLKILTEHYKPITQAI
jgi:hypothetical protein